MPNRPRGLAATLRERLGGQSTDDPNVIALAGPHVLRCSFNGAVYLDGVVQLGTVADGVDVLVAKYRMHVGSAA